MLFPLFKQKENIKVVVINMWWKKKWFFFLCLCILHRQAHLNIGEMYDSKKLIYNTHCYNARKLTHFKRMSNFIIFMLTFGHTFQSESMLVYGKRDEWNRFSVSFSLSKNRTCVNFWKIKTAFRKIMFKFLCLWNETLFTLFFISVVAALQPG